MAKQDDYVRYTIRVPAGLYAAVQEAAGEKSVNAEIVDRLQKSFEDTFSDAVLLDRIKELVLAKRITDLFGPDIADSISWYMQRYTEAADWQAAVEELIKSGLITAGAMPSDDDLPIGGQEHQFWRHPEAQAYMKEKREQWEWEWQVEHKAQVDDMWKQIEARDRAKGGDDK